MKRGERKAQAFGAIAEAGEQGLAAAELARVVDKPLSWLYGYVLPFELRGEVWRRRHAGKVHFVLSSVCAPISGAVVERRSHKKQPERTPAAAPQASSLPARIQLVTPVERPLDRAVRLGCGKYDPSLRQAPRDTVKVGPVALAKDAQAVIPPGLQVTKCPGLNHDPRFQIDAATFTGGEFVSQWRTKRGTQR